MNTGINRPFACTADRVFDGRQEHADRAVVVDGGAVVGLAPVTDLPSDLPVFAFPGCTIIPGLVDAHIHFMRWQGPAYLAHGVTTVRDTGNELRWILDRRREAGDQPWPRILPMGPILDGPAPIHERVSRRCETLDAAVAAVRETLDAGVVGIKLYVGLPADWLPAMVRHCHDRGARASIHCGGCGLRAALRSRVDEFFHLDGVLADVWPGGRPPGWLDAWGVREMDARWDSLRHLADDILQSGITATPTLAYWDSQWRGRTPEGLGPEAAALVPPMIVRWQAAPQDRAAADQWRRALDAALRFTGLLMERGVPLLAGTDVPCGAVPPGLSLWQELRFFTEAGMSPVEALRTATVSAAAFMRRPELGRLGPGSAADLVVVRGNPLEEIPRRPGIVRVMRGGVLHEPADLLKQTERLQEGSLAATDPWARQFEQYD